MKTRETTPGKTYSVHTSSGCTVNDKSGWSKQIDAPDGYFTAHAGEVTIDGDDAADVRELFNLAPQQRLAILGVLGGGVPAWFKALETELTALLDGSKFELAWLAGKNTLVVHTDRLADDQLAAVKATAEAAMPATATLVQYNHNMEISWRDINKYAECVTPMDMYAVDPEKNLYIKIGSYQKEGYFIGDFCSDGSFPYPLPELTTVKASAGYSSNAFLGLIVKYGIKKLEVTLPKLKNWAGGSTDNGIQFKEIILDAPNLENFIENYSYELKRFKCNSLKIKSIFNLAWNAPIESIEADFPALQNGKISSKNGRLNKESVLRICNTVPTWITGTHELWLGIHVDHKTDEEVLEAIANAESKGWTMTVQWNGTPTAQAATTYGLRKPPIYAKVAEFERPDGTTERVLEWGHYVTDPTGYEEFRSVEAAREYFGLPEEPLT